MILAVIQEVAQSPINLLFGANVGLCSAMLALYRDCRNDRAKLWEHIRQLERTLDPRG